MLGFAWNSSLGWQIALGQRRHLYIRYRPEFQNCSIISKIIRSLDIGSIFVQHFPRLDRVSISVADFGRGIPNAVRRVAPHLDDLAAIRKAVESGFTSKSTPGNQGAGLDYLLTTVSSVPTLFEQFQLVVEGRVGLWEGTARKDAVYRHSLEHREAQNL